MFFASLLTLSNCTSKHLIYRFVLYDTGPYKSSVLSCGELLCLDTYYCLIHIDQSVANDMN